VAAFVDPLANVPPPVERRLALRVTPDARHALRDGHPWLFDRAITGASGEGRPGDLAVIFDDRRRFLAIGLYDPSSPIRVRILVHGAPAVIDRGWLRGRMVEAAAVRSSLPGSGTTGYRVVHGENDGLPGLVIDRYDATLVIKLYTPAWIPWLRDLRAALDEVCPAACVVLRLSRDLLRRPEHLFGLNDGSALFGALPAAPVAFTENGLRFEADVLHGQKTGFFFDQRDNRARVERLAEARRTLNVFAYTGGFSLYAARGGAPEVASLDVSAPALAAAERNFALNRDIPAVTACRHAVLAADAFEALAGLRGFQAGRRGRHGDGAGNALPAHDGRCVRAVKDVAAAGRVDDLHPARGQVAHRVARLATHKPAAAFAGRDHGGRVGGDVERPHRLVRIGKAGNLAGEPGADDHMVGLPRQREHLRLGGALEVDDHRDALRVRQAQGVQPDDRFGAVRKDHAGPRHEPGGHFRFGQVRDARARAQDRPLPRGEVDDDGRMVRPGAGLAAHGRAVHPLAHQLGDGVGRQIIVAQDAGEGRPRAEPRRGDHRGTPQAAAFAMLTVDEHLAIGGRVAVDQHKVVDGDRTEGENVPVGHRGAPFKPRPGPHWPWLPAAPGHRESRRKTPSRSR
jgi:23S rRNA (cytosine1962-C5)-methyltransferase